MFLLLNRIACKFYRKKSQKS